MKANELMVGDWFRFNYNTIDGKKIVRNFRISQIENELGKYYVWGNGFGRMCYPDRLEPIPITPEILEKNGFMYCKSDGGVYLPTTISYGNWAVDVILFNVTDEYRNNQLHIGTPDDSITILHLMECNHVHELQHAMRICGIDKEIVI